MANRVYDTCNINANRMNARQAVLNVKQGTPKFEIPKVKRCEEGAPEEINVYPDGSLINTRTNSFKLAGAGVWWPNRKNGEMPLSEAEGDMAFASQKRRRNGTQRRYSWNGGKLHKCRDSSRHNRYGC